MTNQRATVKNEGPNRPFYVNTGWHKTVSSYQIINREHYHSVNSSSHSVNGDIAIQWEWSNFDHSQNPNPLTDYDKTLHN